MSTLSILIPTLPKRQFVFNRLINQIFDQARECDLTNEIEVVVDDMLEPSIGAKRNILLQRATGDYICFIDDDDRIADDYLKLIFSALYQYQPDCCSLHGIITTDGKNPKHFYHSIKHESMYEADGVYYRPPNHLNVVKRELAQQCVFPDWKFAEDSNYCFQLLHKKLLKTEAVIEPVLYYYDYIQDKARHNYNQ